MTLILFVVVLGLLPLWLGLALVFDGVRKVRLRIPFAVSRLLLFGAVYLTAQVVGVLALFGAWLIAGLGLRHAALIAMTYAIQRGWVATLFGAVRAIYGVKVELEGEDTLGAPPGGPVVILMQHTSLVDTLLPTTYLTARRGLKLRWVLKRELLVDPCLDIAGSRLPNAFVARDGSDTERALAQVRALATDLPADEGVLIYPEGTRFTHGKRLRALERLAHDPILQARAAELRRVLPPRPGGPLALIETASQADVVFVAHVGFEGLASLTSVLSGALVGKTIHLTFRRVPRAEIPTAREQRIDWLWREWEALDRWVDAHASSTPASR